MRTLDLWEYQTSEHQFTGAERDALLGLGIPNLDLKPIIGREDQYLMSTGPTVGAVETGELSVLIRPKIGIAQLIAIASYAPDRHQEIGEFNFPETVSLHDALALALARAARMAFGRGVLRGYRTEEDDLLTVRGRIAFAEQLRRRFGVSVPIAVRFDEYTDDIIANQLVKAAAHRLGRLRLRSKSARAGLAWIAGTLQNVSLAEFSRRRLPEMRFDQLNEHYRGAINLSRMILRHVGFESARGRVRAGGFLVNMNELFQEFVFQALRENLARAGLELRSDRNLPIRMHLDQGQSIRLYPDVSCWERGRCTFVGDIKYKNATGDRIPNSDIYQMLAYVTGAGLAHGLLIYAAGEAEQRNYRIRNGGKTVRVAALDLSRPIDEILDDIGDIAKTVIDLQQTAA